MVMTSTTDTMLKILSVRHKEYALARMCKAVARMKYAWDDDEWRRAYRWANAWGRRSRRFQLGHKVKVQSFEQPEHPLVNHLPPRAKSLHIGATNSFDGLMA